MTDGGPSPAEGSPPDLSRRKSGASIDHFARYVDIPAAVLAPVLVVLLVWDLSTTLHGTASAVLDTTIFVLWALFALEFAVRLALAPDRGGHLKTHLFDACTVAVPVLAPLRVLRFVRPESRPGRSLAHLHRIVTHKGLHYVIFTVIMIMLAGSWLELLLENHARDSNIHTYGDAVWWSLVTVMTVGYGDRFPVTSAGRVVAGVLMVAGISLAGVLTATFASFFVQQRHDETQAQLDDLKIQLERIEAMLTERP